MNLKSLCASLIILAVGLTAFADEVTIDGMEFSSTSNTFFYLRKATKDVSPEVIVPGEVEYPKDGLHALNQWYNKAFNETVSDIVTSVKSVDIDGASLYVMGTCFSDLQKLTVVELPAQLTSTDCDLFVNCPALESVTLRSPQLIKIDSPYSSSSPKGNIKNLYVQPNLVASYKKLVDNGDNYEKFFLSQFENILPIETENPGPVEPPVEPEIPAGVHLLIDNLYLTLPDAKPGDKFTRQAAPGHVISQLNNASVGFDTKEYTVTVPQFDHHTVLAFTTGTPGQSHVSATVQNSENVTTIPGGYKIDGYDGTQVIIIDLSGQLIKHSYKSTDTLPNGIYILFYNNQGYKIYVHE